MPGGTVGQRASSKTTGGAWPCWLVPRKQKQPFACAGGVLTTGVLEAMLEARKWCLAELSPGIPGGTHSDQLYIVVGGGKGRIAEYSAGAGEDEDEERRAKSEERP